MKRTKISFGLNTAIIVLVIAALVIMISGIQFMGYEERLTANSFQALKFFTVDSNLLLGLAAFLTAREDRKALKAGIPGIRPGVVLLKYTAVVSTTLTFFIVAAVFAPGVPGGYYSLIKNTNLFFHLIIPVLGMVSFVLFENAGCLKLRHTFAGLVPMAVYGIIYAANVFAHVEDGSVARKYDWYGFVAGGIDTAAAAALSMLVITYLICLVIFGAGRLAFRRGRMRKDKSA